MSGGRSASSALSRTVYEWSVRVSVVIYPLMIASIGLAALSLAFRWIHMPSTPAAVIGFIGFLIVSTAVASQAATVRERQWVLASAALLLVAGIMFALQAISRPVPNALFTLVATMAITFYVVAVVRRDVR